MRIKLVSGLTVLIVGLTTSLVLACNCGQKTSSGDQISSCHGGEMCGCMSGQSVCQDEIIEIKNTTCPVSGKPIGSLGKAVTYTYKGKIYQLCCAGCIEQFKAEPEKYIQSIEVNK